VACARNLVRAAIRDQTHHVNPFHFEVTMSDSSADVLWPPLRRERTLAAESSLLAEPNPGLLGDYPQEVMLKLSKPVIESP
jgi:hypothetical protein